MTVGFYSPLPPARTGVADYAAALLAELRRHGRVEVAPRRCGVALYHLGNNALHAAIYRRALERPGVVVLHDAVLHHFLLGQLDASAYIEEFVFEHRKSELWTDLHSATIRTKVEVRPMSGPKLSLPPPECSNL